MDKSLIKKSLDSISNVFLQHLLQTYFIGEICDIIVLYVQYEYLYDTYIEKYVFKSYYNCDSYDYIYNNNENQYLSLYGFKKGQLSNNTIDNMITLNMKLGLPFNKDLLYKYEIYSKQDWPYVYYINEVCDEYKAYQLLDFLFTISNSVKIYEFMINEVMIHAIQDKLRFNIFTNIKTIVFDTITVLYIKTTTNEYLAISDVIFEMVTNKDSTIIQFKYNYTYSKVYERMNKTYTLDELKEINYKYKQLITTHENIVYMIGK